MSGTNNENKIIPENRFFFRLFISGMSIKSIRAIENLREICELHLPGQFELEIIDVYQQGELASRYQIIATPTLIKFSPAPVRTILGDLSDRPKILKLLGLPIPG